MPPFHDRIGELLISSSDATQPVHARGRLLEELVAEAFSTISGVDVRARNAKSVFENEELDLVMTNRALDDGLQTIGRFFSVSARTGHAESTRPKSAGLRLSCGARTRASVSLLPRAE